MSFGRGRNEFNPPQDLSFVSLFVPKTPVMFLFLIIVPQLGGFGIEVGIWLGAKASVGWVEGAYCDELGVLEVWLSSLGAEESSGFLGVFSGDITG